MVGTTGIPLGTADMTPFLSKISGDFDGLFGIFFGKDGVTIATQAYDLGLTKKYKWAGDGSISESTNLLAIGNKIDGFTAINRYIPVFQGPLDTPYHHALFDEAKARLLRSIRPVRCPINTCSRTSRRSTRSRSAWRSRSSRAATTP